MKNIVKKLTCKWVCINKADTEEFDAGHFVLKLYVKSFIKNIFLSSYYKFY